MKASATELSKLRLRLSNLIEEILVNHPGHLAVRQQYQNAFADRMFTGDARDERYQGPAADNKQRKAKPQFPEHAPHPRTNLAIIAYANVRKQRIP